MKTLTKIATAVFIGLSIFSFAQDNDISKLNKNTYKVGEKLTYRLHYGIIDAGVANLEVKETSIINGKNTLHILGTGRSAGTFNWFFKVRDKYETYIDTSIMAPLKFDRDINEGGYKKIQNYHFVQSANTVYTAINKYTVPNNVQDMLSAFYYARCVDYTNLNVGDEITITTFMDEEIYPMKVKYGGKQNVSTKLGTFRCLKFTPMLQEGRIFKEQEDLTLFVSDDKNHVPVSIQANILFGSVKADLTGYKNLVYPIAKIN